MVYTCIYPQIIPYKVFRCSIIYSQARIMTNCAMTTGVLERLTVGKVPLPNTTHVCTNAS